MGQAGGDAAQSSIPKKEIPLPKKKEKCIEPCLPRPHHPAPPPREKALKRRSCERSCNALALAIAASQAACAPSPLFLYITNTNRPASKYTSCSGPNNVTTSSRVAGVRVFCARFSIYSTGTARALLASTLRTRTHARAYAHILQSVVIAIKR